jgi:multiple sugar transport system substrate-binding protein
MTSINRRVFLKTTAAPALMLAGGAALGGLAMPAVRASAAARTEIAISVNVSSYQKMLDALAAAFSERNPDVAIRYIGKGDNWDPLLQITLRDSIVNDLPDGTWQSLTYAPLLARRGIAQPLDPQFGDVGALEAIGLSKTLVDATTVNGSVFAMPFGTTVPILYYNMDLLRRAGYAAATPPASWNEIIDTGKKVAALGGKINGGFIEYDSTNAWMFQNLLASFGGRMMNADQTDIAFAGPEGLQAMEVLWRFGDTNNIDMTRDQARQAFNAGSEGMLVRSASGTTSVAKAAAGQFELQVGQLPVPSADGRLVGAGHGFMTFAKDPERQKAMWRFMRFAAEPEGQMILARMTGYMPVNVKALNDPEFLKAYLAINPYHRPIVERLAITGDQFSFPTDNTVKIVDMMADVMRQVVRHDTKPDQGLAAMAEQSRNLLQKS